MPPLLGQVSRRATNSALLKILQSSISNTPVRLSSFALVPPCVNCHQRALSRSFSDSQSIWRTRTPPGFQMNGLSIWISSRRALSASSSPSYLQSPQSKLPATSSAAGGQTPPREDLPSEKEGRRTQISKRFTDVMDTLQSNIFLAGQRLNDFTGYSSIEALKKDIEEQENFVRSSRLALRKGKEAYTQAVSQRSASQREVNELLQRKHAWTPADLERFTGLYRSDHANEQAEAQAQDALAEAERVADEAAAKLSKSILARYHEEQIWSDKIRRMSTWGTWGLMGVNVLLFLVFQIGVEPWRRRRLVKGFEEKVKEALENEGAGLVAAAKRGIGVNAVAVAGEPIPQAQNASTQTDSAVLETGVLAETGAPPEAVPMPSVDETPDTELPAQSIFEVYREAFLDLFSDRDVSMRKIDVTFTALEGAATGATVMALAIFITSMIFLPGLGDSRL